MPVELKLAYQYERHSLGSPQDKFNHTQPLHEASSTTQNVLRGAALVAVLGAVGPSLVCYILLPLTHSHSVMPHYDHFEDKRQTTGEGYRERCAWGLSFRDATVIKFEGMDHDCGLFYTVPVSCGSSILA